MELETNNLQNFWNELRVISESKDYDTLYLSGGRTPIELLKFKEFLDFLKSFENIFLTDDRIVPWNSGISNYWNLQEVLQIHNIKIMPLTTKNGKVKMENVLLYENAMCNANRSLSITGFGIDGHYWGLFDTVKKVSLNLIITKNKNENFNRISFSKNSYLSKCEMILIGSKSKFVKVKDFQLKEILENNCVKFIAIL